MTIIVILADNNNNNYAPVFEKVGVLPFFLFPPFLVSPAFFWSALFLSLTVHNILYQIYVLPEYQLPSLNVLGTNCVATRLPPA